VTSGMGAKNKITCVLVSHMPQQRKGRTYGEEDNETGYAEIDPLHLLQSVGSITDILVEHIGR